MFELMNSIELKYYKELGIHERINDKQEQLEYLAKWSAYDHMEMPEYANIMPRRVRKTLNHLTKSVATAPY